MATKIGLAEAKDADGILQQLDVFGVTVNRDWGYPHYRLPYLRLWPYYTSEPDAADANPAWHQGVLWTIPELEGVKAAVSRIISAVGGPDGFKKAMGTTRVAKTTVRWPRFFTGGRCVSPGLLTLYGNFIDIAPEDQQAIVIHEFGHVWDWTSLGRLSWGRGGLARSHPQSTGQSLERPPGITDPDGKRYAEKWPFEDWAVSFHAYVQPEYSAFQPPHEGLGPLRHSFIQEQIGQLQ